jgi:L-amino acid N-acyltransferase YncA
MGCRTPAGAPRRGRARETRRRLDRALTGVLALFYAGVAEISAYVGAEARGQDVGGELLAAAIESSERGGIWTLQTGVFPENAPSLALLRRFGFRELGAQQRIGRLHGIWRDVVLLERRSEVVT